MTNNSTKQKAENTSPQPRTRKEAKQTRQNATDTNERVIKKWSSSGAFSIGLRLIVIVVLIVIAAIAGSMIGYGGIGSGDPISVFNPATWNHVFDILNGVQASK